MESLSIYEQLCFSTTRIETEDENGCKYSGTGFFFNLSVNNTSTTLLVTNKHVVKGMKKGSFRFTTADENGNPKCTEHYTFTYDNSFEQNWIFHPENDVDLCVFPILNLIKDAKSNGKNLFYRCLDNNLIPTADNLSSLDAVEEIIMIGYPNGLWDSTNNMPIVRKGITATNISFDYNGKKEFLIDAACFPGSSGSPVLICNVGGYRDKQGNINWGISRVLFVGILYAGPQLTVTGDIRIVSVPDSQQKAMSIATIPNNLGCIIKSQRILDFAPIIISNSAKTY
jgi:V8-like Glu-specific endopeptidase